ncbi:MAG: hypothetical protein AAF367_19735 [Pseudomonadota bacterium]
MRLTITAILAIVVGVCVFNQVFEMVFGMSAYVLIGTLAVLGALAVWGEPVVRSLAQRPAEEDMRRFRRRPSI